MRAGNAFRIVLFAASCALALSACSGGGSQLSGTWTASPARSGRGAPPPLKLGGIRFDDSTHLELLAPDFATGDLAWQPAEYAVLGDGSLSVTGGGGGNAVLHPKFANGALELTDANGASETFVRATQ